MNTTNRTPQQASIDAREAREAWERGAQVECKWKDTPWDTYRGECPLFVDPNYSWRVAKPTTPTPTITPGKWRMRNGETTEIVPANGYYCWHSKDGSHSWREDGRGYNKIETPFDLISKVETRWRAWKPEEVPLGREVRKKLSHNTRSIITGAQTGGFALSLLVINYSNALAEWELLNPDGTYSPCGVEEEVV